MTACRFSQIFRKAIFWRTLFSRAAFGSSIEEAYSETSQLSKMESLAKIINGFEPLIILQKLLLRCLTGFWIRLWIGLGNFSRVPVNGVYINVQGKILLKRCVKQLKKISAENLSSCITFYQNYSFSNIYSSSNLRLQSFAPG